MEVVHMMVLVVSLTSKSHYIINDVITMGAYMNMYDIVAAAL